MKLFATYKQLVRDWFFPLAIYLAAILLLITMIGSSIVISAPEGGSGALGMDASSSLFVFTALLAAGGFGSFAAQNGVSRKTFHCSKALVAITFSALVSLTAIILQILLDLVLPGRILTSGVFQFASDGVLGYLGYYILAFSLALFWSGIGMFFAGMNGVTTKLQKALIYIGLGITITTILPGLFTLVFDGDWIAFFVIIEEMMIFFRDPLSSLLFSVIAFIALFALSWLMVKRIELK